MKFLARLLVLFGLALGAIPALAQNPGPGPTPDPWTQNGNELYWAGCLAVPVTVTGGCKGDGTINAAGLYVNGVAVATGGAVTSVALALPSSVFSITGSPVTSTGTLTGSFVQQAANTIWGGPATGASSAPTFRALVAADIPSALNATNLADGSSIGSGGAGSNNAILSNNSGTSGTSATDYNINGVGKLQVGTNASGASIYFFDIVNSTNALQCVTSSGNCLFGEAGKTISIPGSTLIGQSNSVPGSLSLNGNNVSLNLQVAGSTLSSLTASSSTNGVWADGVTGQNIISCATAGTCAFGESTKTSSLAGTFSATTQTAGDNSTKVATTAYVATAVAGGNGINIPVRQTVLGGPVTAGVPSFLPATSGSLSITSTGISSTVPLVVAFAQGFGTTGASDIVGNTTANVTWSSLTASSTDFLGFTVSGTTLTTFSTTLAPVYCYGCTPSTTNGQYTFDITQYKMFKGNGSTAPQSNAVFVGEVTTSGSAVTAAMEYAYQRKATLSIPAPFPTTAVVTTLAANIGTSVGIQGVVDLVNVTANLGYNPGDIVLPWSASTNGTTNSGVGNLLLTGRNTAQFVSGSNQSINIQNATTGAAGSGAIADWGATVQLWSAW